MYDYDTKDLRRRFNVPIATIRFLVRMGHLRPRRRGGKLVFSFQDLVVLRSVGALREASIPAYKINRALKKLHANLPSGLPLSGQSLTALGDRIGIRDGRALWEADSGQYALAFDVGTGGGVRTLDPPDPEECVRALAADHYLHALELEDSDRRAAMGAYEKCLRLDPEHVLARINLGRILHLDGRLQEAERVYGGAPLTDPTLAFNMAVLFEDLDREIDALLAYREAITLDPKFADAHFNLARLHERLGNLKDSFHHLLAYQRLSSRRDR